jgi:hypothetical protein
MLKLSKPPMSQQQRHLNLRLKPEPHGGKHYIVTIASIAVRLTPSTKDDEIVGKLLKALKVLSIAPKEEVKK